MLPCTRALIAEAVRKGQQILAGQPVYVFSPSSCFVLLTSLLSSLASSFANRTGPPSARRTEAKESANAGDSDDDDEEPLSARSERKMKEAKEALRKRAENKLTDSKVATSSLKMAEAAIVREDLLKEQVQAANRDVARAQLELERNYLWQHSQFIDDSDTNRKVNTTGVKAEASEQKRELQSRIRDLETLLKQVC